MNNFAEEGIVTISSEEGKEGFGLGWLKWLMGWMEWMLVKLEFNFLSISSSRSIIFAACRGIKLQLKTCKLPTLLNTNFMTVLKLNT